MKSGWAESRWALIAAVLSGALLGLAFPKPGFGLLACIALVPLLFALQTPGGGPAGTVSLRRAFRLGYLTGAVFFLWLLHWIPQLPRENVTIPFAMYPALALMVLYLSLYPALAAWGAAWFARRGVPVGITFPLLWTLLEAARGTGTFGFPWGSLGYALAPHPHLIQFVSYTGLWGATLWLAGLSGLIHLYFGTRWVGPKVSVLLLLVAGLAVPFVHGQTVLSRLAPRAAVAVGVVQPNIGNNKWEPAVRDSVVEALLDHTLRLAAEHRRKPPRLIVWPETAVPARITREPFYLTRVQAVVDSGGVPVLAGFPDGERMPDGTYRFTNSAALLLPGLGVVHQYDKRHLVPFSENFPLPVLNRFDFGQAHFSAGEKPGVFRELEVPFGLLICFESIFPGPARDLSRNGARYLVNITNDQWFGDSAAPEQHFQMNVFRTIENRMGMIRSANTGISGVIDPYGVVRGRTETFVPARLVEPVELGGRLTFYARTGDWVLWLAGAGLMLAGLWSWRRKGAA